MILESFLVDILDDDFRPNPAVLFAIRQIKKSDGRQPVSEVTEKIGYSRRRFSDLFAQITGISPKQYAGIQRFQRTLRTIREHPEPNWTKIALSSGYYDQAHFNHDFKKLSGITPSQYFENKTAEINHLPV